MLVAVDSLGSKLLHWVTSRLLIKPHSRLQAR